MERTVQARVKCTQCRKESWGSETLRFSAVCSSDPSHENKAFAKATPALDIGMTIDNPGAQGRFVEGQEYYLDFTPAPEFVPTPAPAAVENPPAEGNGESATV